MAGIESLSDDELRAGYQRAQVKPLSDLSDDELKRAYAASRNLPDERAIDKKTGAAPEVRRAVGAARSPQDRLATLRKFHPDAQPYGQDNFVFTNPTTGRPTLHNEPGWIPSWGDINAIVPEMYEMGGSIVGGGLALPPAIAAAPATGGLSFLAVPAGIGLGAAAGRELAGTPLVQRPETVDTRGMGERATDIGATAGVNAVAGRAGELAMQGAKRVFGPIASAISGRTGQQVAGDFAAAGVRPTAGAVTGNRGVQMIEQGLSNTPGGAPVMQDVARGQADDFARGIRALVAGQGGARSEQGAGEVIRDATGRAVQRFEGRQEGLYNQAFSLIGADRQVGTPHTGRLLGELTVERGQAMGARDDVLDPLINRARGIVEAGDQGIQFQALRRLRTDIGRMLKAPLQGRVESAQQEKLNALYGSLTRDIHEAAAAAGPAALRALRVADRYTSLNLEVNKKLWKKMAETDADEKAWAYATAETAHGGTRLWQLRRNFTPNEWDTVSATVLDRLGLATPNARGAAELGGEAHDFSIGTFMTNWNKMAPEARNALFSGPRYRDLRRSIDTYARVGERIKDVQRMANPSGTARNAMVLTGIAGAGYEVGQGDPQNAAALLLGGFLAPRWTAQMMTSPAMVRWLTQTTQAAAQRPNSLPMLAGRLTAIAEAEPEIRDEVLSLQQSMGTAIR